MNAPNVILISVDGMRRDDAGSLGNPDVRTPNLDALISHGVVFNQATTCKLGTRPQDPTPFYCPPDTEEDHFFSLFHKAGYLTGAIGHITQDKQRCAVYLPVGDDEARTDRQEHDPDSMSATATRDDRAEDDARSETTWIGNQSVRFCQSADDPFFLWTGFSATTHVPPPWNTMYPPPSFHVPDELENPAIREQLAAYYGALSHMDRQIGRLLATMTARGRTNNLLIFTATRGRNFSIHGNPESAMATCADSVLRVPLVVCGLTGQRKGKQDPALSTTSDIPATLREALQLSETVPLGGQSLLPQLRGMGIPHRSAVLLENSSGIRVIRSARYKWISDRNTGEEWVFNLQSDPLERQNLYKTHQAVAIRKMLAGLI